MNRFKKIIIAVLPVLIIAALSVTSFFFFSGRKQAEPENPLNKKATNSHMLLSFGGEIEFFDEAPDDSAKDENSDVTAEETTEKEVEKTTRPKATEPEITTRPQKEETTKPQADSSEKTTESEEITTKPHTTKQDKNNNPEKETVSATNPANQKDSEITDKEIPDSDSTEVTEVDKSNEELSTSPNISDEKDDESGEVVTDTPNEDVDEELPGEEQKPVEDETDKTYFTTSIKNGETVKKTDYNFEIYHNYPELAVDSVRVYVNDTEVNQFKGNVLLSEGENIIRVAVAYKDENGKVIAVYEDYTVNAKLGKIEIITDLDNQTTATNILEFTAAATYYGKDVPVTVTLNGENFNGENGKYSVKLKNGDNSIVITADNGDETEKREFIINCTALDTLDLYTDLEDKTVNTESIDFTAYILNGTERAKLSVTLNGDPLKGNGNLFTAVLVTGNNRIRIKATDKTNGETVTIDKTFTVKMVPLADEETAPYIRYINVTDGMTVKGNEFKLDIEPVDYKDNRIYAEGIKIVLNGNVYKYNWQSEFTSYMLWFEGGVNSLDIRITDNDGRYTDYSYKINCEVFEDGEEIGTITISIDANVLGLGYIIPPTEIPIYQGENGAKTVIRFLEENGFGYEYDGTVDVGFYLSRIEKSGIGTGVNIPQKLVNYINADGIEWFDQKSDDSLGEFDYTKGSGWMYSVNHTFPNHGFSDAVFKDGDVVRIRFTLAYGKDIGGFTAASGQVGSEGGNNGNYATTW